MQEVYVPKFGKNLVTFSVFWPPYATSAPMGVKFGIGEVAFGISVMLLTLVDSITPNFTPIGAACRPCGEKSIRITMCAKFFVFFVQTLNKTT